MSERLRLEAEMKDGISPKVRQIGKELKEIRKSPGMVDASKWMGEFNEKAEGFVKEGGGVTGLMKGLGVGGLLAATSLGELVKSFQELGARAADMKEVARQTGLTIDQVNQLQRAGEKLRIDPSQMTEGLKHLRSQMFDFKQHMGDLWGELSQQAPDFARKLSLDGPEKQIEDIVRYLGQIKDPELQRRWTELFFGSGEMSRMLVNGGHDFAAALKDAQEHTAAITPELLQQQEKLYQATLDFKQSWEDFETKVGPFIFQNLSKAADKLKGAFDDIKAAYNWAVGAQEHPIDAAKGVVTPWLQDQERMNEEARRKGEGPWIDLPGIVLRGIDSPPQRSEDGNKLRREDEAPVGLLHRSAFTTFDGATAGGGATFGLASIIAEGTKAGVLSAFRELMQTGESAGTGPTGLQKASYEIWDGSAGQNAARPGVGSGGFTPGSGAQGGSFRGGSGRLSAMAKESYDFWRSKGYDHNAALGMVAQEQGESTFDIHAVGDHGQAHGAFQWHADRRAQIRAGTGIDVDTADHRQQLEAAFWESTKGSRAGLAQAMQGLSLHEAVALGVRRFEGSRNQSADIAKRLGMARSWDGGGSFAGGASGSGGHRDGVGAAVPDWMNDRSRREIAAINAPLARDLLEAAKQTGIHFNVAQGLRTQAEANANAASGRGVRDSQHLYGAAADLHLLDAQGRESYDRNLYQRFGDAFESIAKSNGESSRWLGNIAGRWGSDIVHFDQGLGYGQRHARQPFGAGGPTQDDVAQSAREAFASKDNPFLRRRSLDLPDVARKSGADQQTIRHEGGAAIDIRLRSDGSVGPVRTRASGLVTAVNLSRGPTMMTADS